MTDEERATFEAEIEAYEAQLDYGYDNVMSSTKPSRPLPFARIVRRSWWRRALAAIGVSS